MKDGSTITIKVCPQCRLQYMTTDPWQKCCGTECLGDYMAHSKTQTKLEKMAEHFGQEVAKPVLRSMWSVSRSEEASNLAQAYLAGARAMREMGDLFLHEKCLGEWRFEFKRLGEEQADE